MQRRQSPPRYSVPMYDFGQNQQYQQFEVVDQAPRRVQTQKYYEENKYEQVPQFYQPATDEDEEVKQIEEEWAQI